MAIYHCTIKIVKRSQGKSAVAAAAYRSGEKLTNEWDGVTHDYTKKGGIVHSEILIPSNAPPTLLIRSELWNSVELFEKNSDAQLAREIEIALPVELDRKAQLELVRTYVNDTFVSVGMCADFALHDKGDGNPHAHILLTLRPLTRDGSWGTKCRKEYDLDEQGRRIRLPSGAFKSYRVNTTDWNDKGKAELWRSAWSDYANRSLEQHGVVERIDHRSYKRQGVDKIPSIHMGVAAHQMEQRGIATYKGNLNREIAAQNKLLKEMKARMNERELDCFEGMVMMETAKTADNPIPLERLINFTHSIGDCQIAYGVSDDKILGKFYVDNDFPVIPANLPEVLYELLDYEAIGRKERTGEGGVFTEKGYVVHSGEIAQIYKSSDALPQEKPIYTLMLEVCKGYFNNPAYLDYYHNRRIKAKLKGLPPAIHRQQALKAAYRSLTFHQDAQEIP